MRAREGTTTVVPIGDHHVGGVCTRWACGWEGTSYPNTWPESPALAEREINRHLADRHLTLWRTLPTATLRALLGIVDDSTAEWDAIADEIGRREEHPEHHDDTPSLTLPTYAA